MPDGSLLVASMRDHRLLRLGADGALVEHAERALRRVPHHRIWAQVADGPPLTTMEEGLGQLRFAPDGGTLAAEGCVWTATRSARAAAAAPGAGSPRAAHVRGPGLLRGAARGPRC